MSTAAETSPVIPIRLRLWQEGAAMLRVLMISIWVTSWYQVLMADRVPWGAAFLALTAILTISFYLTRLFSRLHLTPSRARLFFLVWLVISLALSLQTMVLATNAVAGESVVGGLIESVQVSTVDFGIIVHLIVVLLLAWRGIAMAQGALDQGEALGSFQTGILALLLYGFVFSNSLPPSSFLPVYAFLLVGLVALATARITDLAMARGGRLPGSFVNWWLPILAAAAVVVAAATLSGWLVGSQASLIAVGILTLFVVALMLVSTVVALPILLLIYLGLPWLRSMFAEGLELLPLQSPNEVADEIFGQELEEIARSMTGIDQSYTILIGIGLITIIAVIILSLHARARNRQHAVWEEATTPVSTNRQAGGWRPFEGGRARRFGGAARFFTAARIRRCYWELMRMGAQLGAPRPPAATPLEYLPHLDSLFPGQRDALRLLTNAYLQVRYGEVPETEEEVRRVTDAWDQIRKEGRRMLREQRAKGQRQPAG